MKLPEVSIIVPVHNAEPSLERLVESLRAQDYPKDHIEIIMVDNGSTDGSAGFIQNLPDVISLSQTQYQTPGATRNAGIERAQGDVIAFIDADCWAHPQWLSTGVNTLLEGKLDRVAGHVAFVFSEHPNLYETYDSTLNFGQSDFVSRGWCGTGNLFTHRSLFEEVGPFDPVLRSAEDCEFGLRATRAGKSLGYAPEAIIYHRARTSLKALVKKWIRTEYGAAQVYRRHGLLPLHLWCKKANYRPRMGVWREFPPEIQKSLRMRLAIDSLSNVLRYAGNFGNFLGYVKTPRPRKD